MLGAALRALGSNARQRAGSALAVAGGVLLVYGVGTYFELTPGSEVVLPDPPALATPRTPTAQPTPVPSATPLTVTEPTQAVGVPTATALAPVATVVLATATPEPAPHVAAVRSTVIPGSLAPPPPTVQPWKGPLRAVAIDAIEGGLRDSPPPGLPTLLRIPKIELETKVVEAGITTDRRGNPIWQTVPNVAAHYGPTAPVGAVGNAVIAGHVVTLYEGNVFRNLYLVGFGDRIEVSTGEATFVYEVNDIQLVAPDAVAVMAPSEDARLTLITCGGRFDRRTQSFDKRLVVVGKLVQASASGGPTEQG